MNLYASFLSDQSTVLPNEQKAVVPQTFHKGHTRDNTSHHCSDHKCCFLITSLPPNLVFLILKWKSAPVFKKALASDLHGRYKKAEGS